jgi:hypothetical protein
VLADTLQHVDEVVLRIDVVQPAFGLQALHDADMPGVWFRPAEQPIFPTMGIFS